MNASKSNGTPLRQRMIADMAARNLNPHTQRSHIHSCKRFAAFLRRSPDTATADEVKAFRLHLIESGASIPNRNRIMTGVKFLLKVTLRRHDLVAEIYHLKEPQKVPVVMSQQEIERNRPVWTILRDLTYPVMMSAWFMNRQDRHGITIENFAPSLERYL